MDQVTDAAVVAVLELRARDPHTFGQITSFDARRIVQAVAPLFAAYHDKRVAELLEANNREVEARRALQREHDRAMAISGMIRARAGGAL